VRTPPLHALHAVAILALFLASGCTRPVAPPPAAAELHRLTMESTNTGAYAEDACDIASEAWALDIARKAVEDREARDYWPHGADYRLIRRSAVQWWVIARRIVGHDDSGRPRFEELWDRGIIIDDLGNVMFYVPAR
jgi:hypothetical protein